MKSDHLLKTKRHKSIFYILFRRLKCSGGQVSLQTNNSFNWKLWSYGEWWCSAWKRTKTTTKRSSRCLFCWMSQVPCSASVPSLYLFSHPFLSTDSSLPRMSALYMQLPNKPNPGVSTRQRAAGRSGRQRQAEPDPTGCLHLQSGGFSDHLEKKLQSRRPKG